MRHESLFNTIRKPFCHKQENASTKNASNTFRQRKVTKKRLKKRNKDIFAKKKSRKVLNIKKMCYLCTAFRRNRWQAEEWLGYVALERQTILL